MPVSHQTLIRLRKLNKLEFGGWATNNLYQLFFKNHKNIEVQLARYSLITIKDNQLLFRIGNDIIHEMAHFLEATDEELKLPNLGMVPINSLQPVNYRDGLREANVWVYEQMIRQNCGVFCRDLVDADRQAQHFAKCISYLEVYRGQTTQNSFRITTIDSSYDVVVSDLPSFSTLSHNFISEFMDNINLAWNKLRKDCRVVVDFWNKRIKTLVES